MVLDIIKLKTTWNDAAGSINSNFAKILKGIRDGIPVVNTPVDDEVSDSSENAIQNKAIKQYVDDGDAYLKGYVEQQATDAEESAKKHTDEKIAQIGEGYSELARRVEDLEQWATEMERATILPLYP